MNKVILLGRLTATPELKTTQSNIPVTSVNIAVNRRFTKPGEERKSDFFALVAWRQNAEFLCKYFIKGQQLSVVGSLQNRSWTDKEGNKRNTTEVVVEEIYFAEGKREVTTTKPQSLEKDGAPLSDDAAPPMPAYSSQGSDFEEITEDGELPF